MSTPVAGIGKRGMVGKSNHSLSEKEVRKKFQEIWRGPKGNCVRECLKCKNKGLEPRFYPPGFKGECVRCGSSLSEPRVPI